MDDPFADIPIVGKGQAGSVPTAPSNDIPIGPNGEQLNLPPNTGATNSYGGLPATQTSEKKAPVEEDPFADIPMLGKASAPASASAIAKPKIELEKDNPFSNVPLVGEVPAELPWYKNLPLSAAAQTAAGAIQTAGGFERAGAAPVTDISGVNAPFQRGATTQEATTAFDKAIADKQSALDSIQGIVKKQGFSTAEYGNQINDLQREIGDLQAQKEQTLKLPQYASDTQQQELIQQRKQLGKEASALSEQAAGMFPALGVNQKDTSIAAQLGRGVGGVIGLAPAMVAGPLALPAMAVMSGSQAYGEGYDAKVQELKQQGVTDQKQLDEAGHQAGSQAAVSSVPPLAAYTVGGALTTAATSALLKGASPLIKGLVGGTAAAGVNLGVSGGLRKAEGGNFLPNVEQAVPDILFGGLHGVGAGLEARAEAKKVADTELGGPMPEIAPSSVVGVNEKEAQIIANADTLHETPTPVVETPTPVAEAPSVEPIASPEEAPQSSVRDAALQQKWEEVQSHPEGSPEREKAFQEYIDISSGKTKPAEAPIAEAPTEEPSATEQSPQPVSGAGETPAVEPTAEVEMVPTPGVLPGGKEPKTMAPKVEYEKGIAELQRLRGNENISLIDYQNVHSNVAQGVDPIEAALRAENEYQAHKYARSETNKAVSSGEIPSGPKVSELYEQKYNERIAQLKPAEVPVAEAQPTEKNAIQKQTTREVGIRNAPAVGEGVGRQNETEVSAQEGQVPKEEVTTPTIETNGESEAPKIIGPSARLMKRAESRGEIIAPNPQEGVSPKESLDRGQNLISKGANAEKVLNNFEATKRFSTDDQDIVRAKTFELAQNAEKASRKGINSPEYIAARDAHQKWIDRSQAMISQAGSALGNLRGGNDIDTGTFYGMQDSFYKTTKSNFTLPQADKAKKLSDKVKSYSEQEQKNQTEFNQGIDNALKDVPSEPISSPDNARQQVADAEPGSTAETNRNASVLEDEKNRIEQQLEEHKKTISDLQEELKSRPSKIKIISEKASKMIDDLANQAEKRIAERRREGRLFSGSPDPTELADYAIIGAKFIKDGALGLGEWTVKMKNKFGDAIEPFLKQIRKQSDDLISQYEKAKASKKTAKKAATDSLESEIKSAKNSISKIGKPSTEIEKETIARLEKQVKKAQSKLDEINAGKVEDPKKLLGPISERVDELQKQKSDIEKSIREIKRKQSEQERTAISDQNLKNKAKNLEPVGENITPKQAKVIWDYAKKFYLDKGPMDLTEMVNKVADDLGLKPENILKAFASPKTMRKKINNLIDAQYNRDVAVKAAKRWLDEQEKSWGVKNLDKAFSLAVKSKIMGHGSAAPGTHAPNLLFSHPLEWLKTWGDAFKYSFTGEKGRRQNYIDNQEVKSDPNFHPARQYGCEVDPDKKQLGYEHSDSENKIIKVLNKFTGGRGYDSLFSLRMRMWNSVWDRLSAEEKTPEFGHFLADWVNHQTGFAHGEYILANNLSKYVFFAKPLYKSRWGWLLGDPLNAGKNLAKWAAGKASPAEKLQATVELRTKMKFMAAYATMLGFNQMLLQATGGNQKVNWTDWKKGDWLAFKGFGYEGTPMYAMTRLIRLLGNEVHVLNPYSQLTSFEKLQGGRKNVFVNNIRDYLAGGWSPGLQDIFAVVTGKDYSGNVMPWSNEKPEQGAHRLTPFQAASEILLPIPIAEAVSQKKWTEGAVKGIASGIFGIQLRTPEDVERFSNIKSHHHTSSRSSSGGN